MAMTISEKLLAKASGNETTRAGDIVWATVDRAMMDDVLGPRVEIADHMKEFNAKVWDPDKVVIISDHYTPPANATQAEIVKFTREWAKEYGVKSYYEFCGPCHQVMVEGGHVSPGQLVVGTDSHTCMYGALGAFSTGIGSTEMFGVLLTGEIWLKVPESLRFTFHGAMGPGVMAKDLILHAIGMIGHAGATYKAMEFEGDTIRNLPMDERLCMTNMVVEAGAKNGIIAPDDITREYIAETGAEPGVELTSDPDATYLADYSLDVADIPPQCACPHQVDNVTAIENVDPVPVDQVYIGSCTGGRYHDLKAAADLLRGKTIAPGIRLLINPASRQVWDRCAKDGTFTTLADAGATILASCCGACLGVHSGDLAAGEVCVSTTNRNFLGRMGSKDSQVYLASPLSAAASAITGKITDPRAFC